MTGHVVTRSRASYSRAAQRVRRLLSHAQRIGAPPPVVLVESAYGIFATRVLGVLVELGIPELLDRPRRVQDLADAIGADREAVERLLRFAAARGFLTARRDGRYAANALTALLHRDHPDRWVDVVRRANSEWFWRVCQSLPEAIGATVEDHDPPPAVETAGSRLQAAALSRDLDWSGVRTLCDVGGGVGVTLRCLLEDHEHLTAVLFDRAPVLDAVLAELAHGPLAARCTLTEGDYFVAVPPGCDRYLLMAVMTQCSDDEAVHLLQVVAASLPPGGAVLVVDNVLSVRPVDEMAQLTDLLLLTMGVGQERTREHYESLFAQAGLAVVTAHALRTGSVAFELSAR